MYDQEIMSVLEVYPMRHMYHWLYGCFQHLVLLRLPCFLDCCSFASVRAQRWLVQVTTMYSTWDQLARQQESIGIFYKRLLVRCPRLHPYYSSIKASLFAGYELWQMGVNGLNKNNGFKVTDADGKICVMYVFTITGCLGNSNFFQVNFRNVDDGSDRSRHNGQIASILKDNSVHFLFGGHPRMFWSKAASRSSFDHNGFCFFQKDMQKMIPTKLNKPESCCFTAVRRVWIPSFSSQVNLWVKSTTSTF